jgi:XTP/dITP diphosphohydrolase
MDLLIATTNPGKTREFRQMLGVGRFNWISLSDLPRLADVDETGHTFRANAMLKATEYARRTGLWTICDDSGLEVDALNRSPGIYSARWAKLHGVGEGDAANNALLLQQLNEVMATSCDPLNRSARFVCVLALADPRGRVQLTTRATMEGQIGFAPVGNHGFGYDPLFVVNGLGCTSAELPPAEKHRVSHRGEALKRMKGLLDCLDLRATLS